MGSSFEGVLDLLGLVLVVGLVELLLGLVGLVLVSSSSLLVLDELAFYIFLLWLSLGLGVSLLIGLVLL